jgi:hypothetical protein
MSAIATRAPASTISRAVSAPMPRAAPDRNAILPSSRFMGSMLQTYLPHQSRLLVAIENSVISAAAPRKRGLRSDRCEHNKKMD